jgi:hypothetical protein
MLNEIERQYTVCHYHAGKGATSMVYRRETCYLGKVFTCSEEVFRKENAFVNNIDIQGLFQNVSGMEPIPDGVLELHGVRDIDTNDIHYMVRVPFRKTVQNPTTKAKDKKSMVGENKLEGVLQYLHYSILDGVEKQNSEEEILYLGKLYTQFKDDYESGNRLSSATDLFPLIRDVKNMEPIPGGIIEVYDVWDRDTGELHRMNRLPFHKKTQASEPIYIKHPPIYN